MPGWEEAAKTAITSALDITNKLTAAASAETFPHITDDVPLGNFNFQDEFGVKTNFVLFRIAQSMGAKKACLQFLAEADEVINVSRGRHGFQNRILRSNISQTTSAVRDETSTGWNLLRGKNQEG